MVEPKKIPAGDAVGFTVDGRLNIGTPDEMKKQFEEAKAESASADLRFAYEQNLTEEDLDDGDEATA